MKSVLGIFGDLKIFRNLLINSRIIENAYIVRENYSFTWNFHLFVDEKLFWKFDSLVCLDEMMHLKSSYFFIAYNWYIHQNFVLCYIPNNMVILSSNYVLLKKNSNSVLKKKKKKVLILLEWRPGEITFFYLFFYWGEIRNHILRTYPCW